MSSIGLEMHVDGRPRVAVEEVPNLRDARSVVTRERIELECGC
jgi:hypothetical protein